MVDKIYPDYPICNHFFVKTSAFYGNWLIAFLILAFTDNPVLAVNPTLTDSLTVDGLPVAQSPVLSPQFPQPQLPDQPLPPLLPAPEDLLEISPPANIPEQMPQTDLEITVKRYEIENSRVFTAEQIDEITKPFTGNTVTFAKILEAEKAITKLYVENGYINSGAIIEAQTIKDGVVKVRVIEGEIQEIRVTGTRRLHANYIRSRLAIATSKPFNSDRLIKALQLLQLNPLIQTLSAKLSAGSRQELSLLEVEVTEADSFNLALLTNNGRVPSVGSFRRGIEVSEGNLLGFGDGLIVNYANTDGSDAFDIRYTFPLNAYNSTFSVGYGITTSNVIEPPYNRVDITGNSHYYELTLRQPIFQRPNREIALGVTASRQESATTLLGENYPLSPGADDQGKTRISALRFFQDYTQRNRQSVFAVRSQFSLGINAFDATINNELPDSRFLAWRGQAQYVRLLQPGTLLVLRSNAQLSTTSLVPLEQFALGGLDNIRGYRQDAFLTDNGFLASAEVRYPIYQKSEPNQLLQIVPFIDFGMAWNHSGLENPDPNTLLGVGLGLQLQLGNRLITRVDYGIPLIEIDTRERTWQEQGLYFSVQYNPF